ncbi:MAG: imidazoleglycerol-phosphate dehydratase HisB [Bacterioplanes sp.]|nr:imidazoleglycerol-phosphate dehydratase HisB [Bacterioplanes sp.]
MLSFSFCESSEQVMARTATIERNTLETQIQVSINLDGTGAAKFDTGVPFLEHMMDQIARHGLIDLDITCKGDNHIDDHHSVEDIGITLGQAFAKAVGDKKGMTRYGHSYVPLDEALSRVVIDFSGRPGLSMNVEFTRASIGRLDTQLFWEFFQGFVNHANVTLHIDNLKGFNAHHQAETIFKAFGRALRMALELDPRMAGVMPSTKGCL